MTLFHGTGPDRVGFDDPLSGEGAEADGDALDALEAEFGGRDDSSLDLAVSPEDDMSAAAGDAPSP